MNYNLRSRFVSPIGTPLGTPMNSQIGVNRQTTNTFKEKIIQHFYKDADLLMDLYSNVHNNNSFYHSRAKYIKLKIKPNFPNVNIEKECQAFRDEIQRLKKLTRDKFINDQNIIEIKEIFHLNNNIKYFDTFLDDYTKYEKYIKYLNKDIYPNINSIPIDDRLYYNELIEMRNYFNRIHREVVCVLYANIVQDDYSGNESFVLIQLSKFHVTVINSFLEKKYRINLQVDATFNVGQENYLLYQLILEGITRKIHLGPTMLSKHYESNVTYLLFLETYIKFLHLYIQNPHELNIDQLLADGHRGLTKALNVTDNHILKSLKDKKKNCIFHFCQHTLNPKIKELTTKFKIKDKDAQNLAKKLRSILLNMSITNNKEMFITWFKEIKIKEFEDNIQKSILEFFEKIVFKKYFKSLNFYGSGKGTQRTTNMCEVSNSFIKNNMLRNDLKTKNMKKLVDTLYYYHLEHSLNEYYYLKDQSDNIFDYLTPAFRLKSYLIFEKFLHDKYYKYDDNTYYIIKPYPTYGILNDKYVKKSIQKEGKYEHSMFLKIYGLVDDSEMKLSMFQKPTKLDIDKYRKIIPCNVLEFDEKISKISEIKFENVNNKKSSYNCSCVDCKYKFYCICSYVLLYSLGVIIYNKKQGPLTTTDQDLAKFILRDKENINEYETSLIDYKACYDNKENYNESDIDSEDLIEDE